ncbi:MAG TPA: polysaccharide deacetylase family protein [Solirubrobacteraceae bacterium]|jgi:peptidoglycan/xylan/chitin deacetylase (PgdA/CDA1 family)|nr:polysaccharide deacetylase family protein [Solirubrobacteraceae bacterium]
MDPLEPMGSRAQRARAHRRRAERRRRVLAASVVLVCAVVIGVALTSGGGTSSGSAAAAKRAHAGRGPLRNARTGYAPVSGPAKGGAAPASSAHTVTTGGTISTVSPTARGGAPGTTPVPVLMYHVIAAPPPGAPFPGLYVPASEFAAQMQALKSAGWHAVTLDQLRAYWTRGVPLGPGKPVVLTFDNGYHSQYAAAFPTLQRLGWVADENMQLTGLPPSQGGLTDQEIKALVAAGWELDTQGINHADLITLGPSALYAQTTGARKTIQRRFHVPVNWFCYPSGHYNATVIAAVRAAGYVGSTTVVPGWAHPSDDPYALHRLRVLGGTSPAALLSQISQNQGDPPAPAAYTGA